MKPLIALAFGFGIVTAAAADDMTVKSEIQSRYAAVSRAFVAKDAKTFEAAFAKDFWAKAPGRSKMTRAQVLKDFEGQMKMLSDVSWNQIVTGLKAEGKVVHVTIDTKMTASMAGPDGKTHSFRLETKGTKSDWVKNSGIWQVKYSESGNLKMWMDGKSMTRG